MARLFIALILPEWAQDALAEAATGLPGADWTESIQYHLTLRFLGDTDPDLADAIARGLDSLSAKSFTIDLKGLGVFPLRGDPDVLWAGVARNDALASLRNKVEHIVVRAGAKPEGRKFHPHVTIARVRSVPSEYVGAFVAAHSLLSVREVPIQSFGLFSSRLAPEGAEHFLEREYGLEGLLEAE